MSIYTADDTTPIYYEEHGERHNPALLLLPGLLGSLTTQWRSLLPALSEHYYVVATDLRGHGSSGNMQSSLRVDRMMHDVAGLLDTLAISSVHIGGYSLGGYIGLLLHLHRPQLVETLLMHATKFYWNEQVVAGMKKQLNPETISLKVPRYAAQLAAEHGDNRWEQMMREAAEMIDFMPSLGLSEEEAAKAICPVLVSAGNRDDLVPVEETLRLSRALPAGELLILPGVRHPFPTIPQNLLLAAMLGFHKKRE